MRRIIEVAIVLIAASLFLWTWIRSLAGALPAVLVGVATQFAVIAEQALNVSFVEIQQNEAVAARLGGPLVFPPLEAMTWENPSPQLQDRENRIVVHYAISGPKGTADVTTRLKVEQDALRVVELEVVPNDDGPPIEIQIPPE